MTNVKFCSDLQRTLHHDEWFLKRAISSENKNPHVGSNSKNQNGPCVLHHKISDKKLLQKRSASESSTVYSRKSLQSLKKRKQLNWNAN